ncbi:membrane-spanning 4-domains subfamily A member 4D-like [Mus caroli]|uniref:Membrane-spanning 4-domains subfamily A member 4D-like n=1 Tax=Mus caroli TaxID=10089 RepID=A0A6P5P174_MUSCR|nr:membrane-spanning 4-domains subfamily A member 4D-like [Mus caroli]
MQGQEQTTMTVVPGVALSSKNSVMKSQMWDEKKEKFLKGEPKVLGVIQVVIALINVSLGIIILKTLSSELPLSVISMVPFWGSIMFIVSGSLSIAAGVRPTKCLIISSLTLNTITSVMAAIACIMSVVSVVVRSHSLYGYNHTITKDLDILMLIFNILEFCLAVSVSAFGCEASCCNSREVLLVLPSNPVETVMASPMTLQPLLPSEHQGKNVPGNVYKNHPGEIV